MVTMNYKTACNILEINNTKELCEKEIKKQYRRLALIYHPDKNNGDDSNFKKISYAYDILQNDSTRNEYNKKTYINEDVVKQFRESNIAGPRRVFVRQPISSLSAA